MALCAYFKTEATIITIINISLHQLRGMIGQKVMHGGIEYVVVEVLEHSTELVLQEVCETTTIQANQHGDAHRKVPSTITIPVLSANKTELHPHFLALELH